MKINFQIAEVYEFDFGCPIFFGTFVLPSHFLQIAPRLNFKPPPGGTWQASLQWAIISSPPSPQPASSSSHPTPTSTPIAPLWAAF